MPDSQTLFIEVAVESLQQRHTRLARSPLVCLQSTPLVIMICWL